MKSGDLSALVTVARALLTEWCASYACAITTIERDISRICRCADSRGLEFFTLDLPSMDAYLLDLLEHGKLPASGFLMKRKSKDDARPRFLHGLWSRVADARGCLLSDADPTSMFFMRQLFCLAKKLRIECAPSRVQTAVQEYHDIESAIIPAKHDWSDDVVDFSDCDPFRVAFATRSDDLFGRRHDPVLDDLLGRLDKVSGLLTSELGIFDPLNECLDDVSSFGYKHGPGAVSDGRGLSFKYRFPTWDAKLAVQFPFDWCGSASLEPDYTPSFIEPPSKLIAVPKTAKGPRLIASEPTSHQWCQQWVKTRLLERSRRSLIGLFFDDRDQTASQRLVTLASETRSLATLDLSSASDRVSCRHVESLFRANKSLLEVMHACRTRWVVDRISSPPQHIRIRKFAAMGSALTFPVQSIFFLACALASAGAHSRESVLSLKGKVRVFGDDIIVPSNAYDPLVSLLTHLGLKVNTAKSFVRGHFRESCGVDAWRGFDITPVKPKTLVVNGPESWQALLDTCNNLFHKGLWYTADILRSTSDWLGKYPAVVSHDSGLPGFHSYTGTLAPRKWNSAYQRYDWVIYQIRNKAERVVQDGSASLLQYFAEDPSSHTLLECKAWASGLTRRTRAVLARGRVADVLTPA